MVPNNVWWSDGGGQPMCKIWRGAKTFTDAVDQLFGYAAWRDSKLAVVMFVGEKNLSDIIDKARDALAAHDEFEAWGKADNEQSCERRCGGRATTAATPRSTSSSCTSPRARDTPAAQAPRGRPLSAATSAVTRPRTRSTPTQGSMSNASRGGCG